MLWWLHELSSPFNYLRIREGKGGLTSKLVVDLILPAFLSVLSVAATYLLLGDPKFLGDGGLFKALAPAFQIFTAFFIAALAAVATFNREGLDSELKGQRAWIRSWSNSQQKHVKKPVTRRMYVCQLFAYLAGLCLLFVMFIAAASVYGNKFWEAAISYFGAYVANVVEFCFSAVFFFVVWSVFLLSLVAVRFLADRLQNMDEDYR